MFDYWVDRALNRLVYSDEMEEVLRWQGAYRTHKTYVEDIEALVSDWLFVKNGGEFRDDSER